MQLVPAWTQRQTEQFECIFDWQKDARQYPRTANPSSSVLLKSHKLPATKCFHDIQLAKVLILLPSFRTLVSLVRLVCILLYFTHFRC